MADFVNTTTTKTAVRDLTAPIADITAFVTLVQDILDTNPWECTTYQSAGQSMPAVSKTREYYSGRIIYENGEAKTVGQVSVRAPTAAAFNTSVSTVLSNTALTTAMGGTPSHDSSEDKFSCTLRCHDENGELYSVALSRDAIRLSSFEEDTIRTTLETWADAIPALA
jgi:hypothetical protein